MTQRRCLSFIFLFFYLESNNSLPELLFAIVYVFFFVVGYRVPAIFLSDTSKIRVCVYQAISLLSKCPMKKTISEHYISDDKFKLLSTIAYLLVCMYVLILLRKKRTGHEKHDLKSQHKNQRENKYTQWIMHMTAHIPHSIYQVYKWMRVFLYVTLICCH